MQVEDRKIKDRRCAICMASFVALIAVLAGVSSLGPNRSFKQSIWELFYLKVCLGTNNCRWSGADSSTLPKTGCGLASS